MRAVAYSCVIPKGKIAIRIRGTQMTLYRFGKTAAVAGIAAVALGGLLVMSGRGQAFDRTRRRPGFEESAGARNSPGAAELVREGQSPGRTWKLHHECRVRLQLLPHVEPWCGICVWQKPLLTGAASREGQSGSLPGWRKRFWDTRPRWFERAHYQSKPDTRQDGAAQKGERPSRASWNTCATVRMRTCGIPMYGRARSTLRAAAV